MKLYNNILNEVLKVYDFDSWDGSQEDFKKDIHDKLVYRSFVYGNPIYKSNTPDDFQGRRKVIKIWEGEYWPLSEYYKNNVYIDGKNITVGQYGHAHFDEFPDEEEWVITINELDGIKNCDSMFYNCEYLIMVPWFDAKQCTTMRSMFECCRSLISVPKLDMKSCKETIYMFSDCGNLDDETLRIYKPDEDGTPHFK